VNELEYRLSSVSVTAVSQDGEIRARARGPEDLVVEVAGNSFRSYTERSLEYQLDQLSTVLWVRYHRAYLEAAREYLQPVDEDAWAGRDNPVTAKLATLVIHGWSTQRTVTVVTRGLVDWNYHIEDGTIMRLRCGALCDEISAAARSAIGYFGAYSSVLLRQEARAGAVALDLEAWRQGRLW
jgi:hypothetical protein